MQSIENIDIIYNNKKNFSGKDYYCQINLGFLCDNSSFCLLHFLFKQNN